MRYGEMAEFRLLEMWYNRTPCGAALGGGLATQ
jgi:hypothetical protein